MDRFPNCILAQTHNRSSPLMHWIRKKILGKRLALQRIQHSGLLIQHMHVVRHDAIIHVEAF